MKEKTTGMMLHIYYLNYSYGYIFGFLEFLTTELITSCTISRVWSRVGGFLDIKSNQSQVLFRL